MTKFHGNKRDRFNPVIQARKLEKLSEQIDRHGKALNALSKTHDNHIAHLGNFARHDIKNALLNLDTILTTTAPNEFDQEKVESMKMILQVIQETMDNFAKLVPYSPNGKFKLENLMVAVELICRNEAQTQKIKLDVNYPRKTDVEINLPFQSIFQMINNLIINSLKSIESTEVKKIQIDASITNETILFLIKDSGETIKEKDKDKIFDYGYSTTNGSGIGLYHAQYICEHLEGEISVDLSHDSDFSKTFRIILPTNGKDNSNN